MKKRGISAVVATVLIILITVAAVTIVWTTVIPMIQEEVSFDEELVDLTIETMGGYTVWDSDEGIMSLQVGRGADNLNFSQIQVVIKCGGNSNSFNVSAPERNQKKSYNFIPGCEPESVSVAPIFGSWEERKVGTVISKVEKIPSGSVSLGVGDNYIGDDGLSHNLECNVATQAVDCDDELECTEDICLNNVCINSVLDEGTTCSEGICDGQGNCGVCSVSNPCEELDCKTATCVTGECVYENLAEGSSCSEGMCDNNGFCAVLVGDVFSECAPTYFDSAETLSPAWAYLGFYLRLSGNTCVDRADECFGISWIQDVDWGCWNGVDYGVTNRQCLELSNGGEDIFKYTSGNCLSTETQFCVGDKFYIYESEADCLASLF